MFSKSESKKLREDFWISFGKSYPTKWILYHTKIKDFSFKFHFDTTHAMVSLDIENKNLEKRIALWEKIISLKSVLLENYISELQFEEYTFLENHTEISRIYINLEHVSIHNKNTWQQTMLFFNENMHKFEEFFRDFETVFSD
ncbi:DUF4268 domain-containing protein [Cellulophaga sp. E16_2]|uniref:DUF4268 domain-containing protein n=1 Tax=Cellulophaga algicola (strain DSM 14237 / IC166 / ACAM 630) TaxID=688270 RepID=E6XAG7_CELAD|nr:MULTISPECIES: DUF4268 domain-containing protein [Cellulophaga]ADV49883.1 hypothetical protein Celal_2598 [Cellulophaga algicola DSM 14237]MBO0592265.1 DUF4268 domain-containing protein [Cellulophaga sp. E16_2]